MDPRPRPYSMPFGELFSLTLTVATRNFVPFFLLGLLVFTPWAALEWLWQSYQQQRLASDQEVLPFQQLLGTLGLACMQGLGGLLLTGIISTGVMQQLRGKPASVGACIHTTLHNLGRILGTGILAGLRMLVGYMLFVIPGIIETCRLFVAMPAALMEGTRAGASVARSIDLTRGSRWQIFGLLLLGYVVMVTVSGIATTLFLIARPVGRAVIEGSEMQWLWLWGFQAILHSVVYAVTATAQSVAYFLLRRGKENVDIRELAAVFA